MAGTSATDALGDAANAGTTAVRTAHRFDEAALARWLAAHVAGFAGPLTVEQFKGGQSNPTYRLSTPTARYVLRRKPPGPLLKGAHDVLREARILAALAGTDVPVAPVHAVCADDGIIGTPFFVMGMVEGRIVWDATFPDVPDAERAGYFDAMNATIAALHRVDPDAVGLGDYGRPGNYFERQIARWSRQYRDAQTDDIASMERVMAALPTRIPADERAGIVHGDFRQENIMFAPAGPDVIALLDWELSTLGAPLADLGFFCLFYHADFMHWGSNATIDFAATGIPTEAEFVDAYCAASGRGQIDDFAFYLGFSAFRLASIAQGVHKRTLAGNARALHDGRNGARDWADLAERLLDDHR